MTRLIFLSLTIPLSTCAHRFLSLQSRCRENSLRPHRTPHQYKLRKSPIKVANYDPSRAASTAGPLHPPSLPALSLSRLTRRPAIGPHPNHGHLIGLCLILCQTHVASYGRPWSHLHMKPLACLCYLLSTSVFCTKLPASWDGGKAVLSRKTARGRASSFVPPRRRGSLTHTPCLLPVLRFPLARLHTLAVYFASTFWPSPRSIRCQVIELPSPPAGTPCARSESRSEEYAEDTDDVR
jgi:hypothetical protein